MKSRGFFFLVILTLMISFVAVILWAAPEEPYNRPDPLMDYVPQELGLYDTGYWELSEADCRHCHGDHHDNGGFCLTLSGPCHNWDDVFSHGWHHNSELSGNRKCEVCHVQSCEAEGCHNSIQTSIAAYVPPVSFADDPPNIAPPPTPFACESCHWEQDVTAGGHPSTYNHGVTGYYEYGKNICDNKYIHHMDGKGGNVASMDNCDMCHKMEGWQPDPNDQEAIRYCESCHTKEVLHEIHARDIKGWEAVGFHVPDKPEADPDTYSGITRNEKCIACHGMDVSQLVGRIAVVNRKSNGKQRLFVFNPPHVVQEEMGSAIASDITFGNTNSMSNIDMAGVDIDGNGVDEIAVINQKSDGKQRLLILNAPSTVGGETGPPIASDASFGNVNGLNNVAIAGVDVNGDGIDEIAVINKKSDGKQRLLILNAPSTVGGETGPPIASDLTFGNVNGLNNVAIAGVDVNGDGIDEIAVINQKSDGKQRLLILNAPSTVGGETGPPIASDLTFGNVDTSRNVAMCGVDIDGDGIDEIAVINQKSDGKQRLLILNAPSTVGGETGPAIASDLTFGNANDANSVAMAGLKFQ